MQHDDIRLERDDAARTSSENSAGASPVIDDPIIVEPLTLSLMGRFFAVPLLIISLIVGGAVCVVLLFGGPATAPQRSILELVQTLEANSGERSLGLLLTQEKDLWQTALELGKRLENKESELTRQEVQDVASRITKLLRADLASLDYARHREEDRPQQERLRSTRLVFLIRALGRTELPSVIDPLLAVVRSREEPYATVAIHELADLHNMVPTEEAVTVIAGIVQDTDRVETLLTACPALSVLAAPGNPEAIDALKTVYVKFDGEVSWSAALALARLGSNAARSSVMDLLDRGFWESGERYETRDEQGQMHRYAMPPDMIERWLLAALDVVPSVNDADLWEMVDRLKSDPSLAVQAKANELISART